MLVSMCTLLNNGRILMTETSVMNLKLFSEPFSWRSFRSIICQIQYLLQLFIETKPHVIWIKMQTD